MARYTLFGHIKFEKLCRYLSLPEPYALGHLEFLWHRANTSESPQFASAEDVEVAAKWLGEEGAFAEAARKAGFLERGECGSFIIHDYEDHCPSHVKTRGRMRRYRERGRNGDAVTTNEAVTDERSDVTVTRESVTVARCYGEDKIRQVKTRQDKPSEEKKPSSSAAADPAGFVQFWEQWPAHRRKVGRSKCKARWIAEKLEAATPKILAALRVCKAGEQWAKQGGEFIPMPMTWLNQTPWETDLMELATEPRGEGDYESGLSQAELFAQERQFLPPEPTGPPEQTEGGEGKDDNDDLLWEH